MTNTLFAFDIHDDLITGVMVECVAKAHTVKACGIVEVGSLSLETALSEVVEQVGFTEGPCRVALGAEHFFFRNLQFPFTDKNKIAKIIPGELAEHSPLEAENMVFDVLYAQKTGSDANIIAAIAEKTILDDLLALLRGKSIDPEALGVSGTHGAMEVDELGGGPERFIYLDVGFRHATLILIVAGQITLVRSLVFDPGLQAGFRLTEDKRDISAIRPENQERSYAAFSRSVRQTILASRVGLQWQDMPLYLAGPLSALPDLADVLRRDLGVEVRVTSQLSRSRPLVKIEDEVSSRWHAGAMDRALSLALGLPKGSQVFNFRKGELKKRGSFKDYRRYGRMALLPFALLSLLIVFALWHDYSTLSKQQVGLERQIREVFSQTLPEVSRIVDPVQQLQVRIKEAKQAYMTTGSADAADLGVLALLSEISGRIPASLQVRMVKMVADQNDVRLKGTTANFNIVDSMQKELGKSPYFAKVEISSANLSAKGGAVEFELKLDLRR